MSIAASACQPRRAAVCADAKARTAARARTRNTTNVSSIVSDEIYKLVTPTKTVKASVVLLILLAARVPYKY